MFLSRSKKNNVYPCKPQLYYIKVGFKGVADGPITARYRFMKKMLAGISILKLEHVYLTADAVSKMLFRNCNEDMSSLIMIYIVLSDLSARKLRVNTGTLKGDNLVILRPS